MSCEDKLKKLKIHQIKAQCTRALNTITSDVAHDMPLAQLSERKAKVEVTWAQFDEVQSEIEFLQESAELFETHTFERTEYEEVYYDIIARFQDSIIGLATQLAFKMA